MNKIIPKILSPIYGPIKSRLHSISTQVDRNAVLLGQIMSHNLIHGSTINQLPQAEFKVFSQFGEDGIIQYLISKVRIHRHIFVEFGVEEYGESNTRFLLMSNKWSGLVIEADDASVRKIQQSDIYWKCSIRAVSAFITQDNINEIIEGAGIKGDIGLLSIDIDGNDFWIWQAIKIVQPRIVICEFNRNFGPDHAITVPYKPDFNHVEAHPSRLYYGASLQALCLLAEQKGYDFVGCTSEGVNAFFVRKDVSGGLIKLNAKEGYDLIDSEKHFPTNHNQLMVIEQMEVFDVKTGGINLLRYYLGVATK